MIQISVPPPIDTPIIPLTLMEHDLEQLITWIKALTIVIGTGVAILAGIYVQIFVARHQ